jgi:hypothetical protein
MQKTLPRKRNTLFSVANENPALFDAFQSVQDEIVEGAMERLKGKGYVAALIGKEAGRALFIGLFSIADSLRLRPEKFTISLCIGNSRPLVCSRVMSTQTITIASSR